MPSILVQIVMSAAANTRRQLDGRRLILLRFAIARHRRRLQAARRKVSGCVNEAATIVAASVRALHDLSPLRSLFSVPLAWSSAFSFSHRSKVSSET